MAGKPIGSFYVGLGLDTRDFQRKMRLAERDLKAAFGSAAIRTSQLLAASIAGVATAVGYLGAKSVKLAADLEVQTVAFERLLGSADAAKAKLEELQTFAAATPFTFTELTDATKRLLALGYAADEIKPVLTSLGDAAFGLGRGNEGLHLMIKAFGDIRTKGYLMTQEVRQLAENGVPAFEILAQKIGVSIPDAMQMVEDRAISSQVAINAFMSGINDRFGGMMEIQSQTMLGMWSTIVDEAENSMRIVGKQITQSAGLQSAMQRIRDEAIAFRTTLQDAGFSKAFSDLFGENARLVIFSTAAAITGTLIPSIAAAGIALKTAIVPLSKVALMYGAIAAAVVLITDKAKELMSTKSEFSGKSLEDLKSMREAQLLKYGKALSDLNRLTDPSQSYRRAADQTMTTSIMAARVQEQGALARLAQIDNAIALVEERHENAIHNAKMLTDDLVAILKDNPGTSFLKNITGLGTNSNISKMFEASKSKSTAKSEADKLSEDAKRTSKSILQTYTSQVLGKKAMLDLEYQQERENLDRSKSQNKNYRRDLFMLDEVFYQRRIELEREAADEEAKLNVEMAQSHADYIEEQMEADWAEAEANAQRIQAIQDGSALEAQLQADMQAADLDAYVAHLDQKQAAYRAHLEGNRNLMNVYDQLQRDAHRTNADFMAESYRTVYSGLTDALTGIVTGAKNAGEAFRELGMQIIQMVVKWQIQQKLASVMSASIRTATTAASVAQAAIITAAWAPAAAMVNAATFGAAATSGAAATAGAVSMMGAAARAFSPVPFANGGIVTKPTLAMIGEGGESEAVIPLSRLGEMGGGANVQVNVINQTGVPVNARTSQRTDGGKVVVDLFLEGYSRNVSGIQDIIGRRS